MVILFCRPNKSWDSPNESITAASKVTGLTVSLREVSHAMAQCYQRSKDNTMVTSVSRGQLHSYCCSPTPSTVTGGFQLADSIFLGRKDALYLTDLAYIVKPSVNKCDTGTFLYVHCSFQVSALQSHCFCYYHGNYSKPSYCEFLKKFVTQYYLTFYSIW